MASALAYQLGHGTLGVPISFPTRTGQRCGHYIQINTSAGRVGFRLIRDPNSVCGLPVKSVSGASLAACISNPNLCATAQLPPGVTQIGTAAIAGRTPSETLGNIVIR